MSGSAMITRSASTSLALMFWNEIDCSPRMVPISSPTSSLGKKPFGMARNSSTVSTMVSGRVSATSRRCRSAQARLSS